MVGSPAFALPLDPSCTRCSDVQPDLSTRDRGLFYHRSAHSQQPPFIAHTLPSYFPGVCSCQREATMFECPGTEQQAVEPISTARQLEGRQWFECPATELAVAPISTARQLEFDGGHPLTASQGGRLWFGP